MQEHFREEIPIPVEGLPGHFEWWQIGLDVDEDQARPFVSYGGIAYADAPVAVLKIAVPKWAQWLATL